MTVEKNTHSDYPFKVFEQLKDRLLYGVSTDVLPSTIEELIRNGLYLKGASFRKSHQLEITQIAKQWIWPEAHHFLQAVIESREKNLIYEWAQILKSKNGCLPANTLSGMLEWASKDLNLAQILIPVLGAAGKNVAEWIPEWNMFSDKHWEHPLNFEKADYRIFAFRQFRYYNPENAFAYFIEHHQKIKEAEKLKCLRILAQKITEPEIDKLIQTFESTKTAIQFELVNLLLQHQESVYYQKNKQLFINHLKNNTPEHFQFNSSAGKNYKWSTTQVIKSIPSSYFEDEELALKYIKWVESIDEEPALLESLQINPSQAFLKFYFNHLLSENKLDEEFPTALLSTGFDFSLFTQACIHWIDQSGDRLDVEAFLHFINLEKHFWSDELLAKILGLRNNKALDRKYDFTIFWQLLPYKVNPNSIHVKSVPAECRIFQSNLLNFDTIIQFRKMIRV